MTDQAGGRAPLRASRRLAKRGVLWSTATARDIAAFLIEDVEAGLLAPAEAWDLIARVQARAAPTTPPPAPRGRGRHGRVVRRPDGQDGAEAG